jgi:hypothetical protein
MVSSSTATANLLTGFFQIRPDEHHEYVINDPVLIVVRNSTYYAPEEIMAVPLTRPAILTFGSMPAFEVRTSLPRIHLELPDRVQDRIAEGDLTFRKTVDIANLHGAILFRDNTLFYKHLCDSPTVIAQKVLASRSISRPGVALPIHRDQTVGFGASTDAFGGLLWWYYFRVTSLAKLKARLAARRQSRA